MGHTIGRDSRDWKEAMFYAGIAFIGFASIAVFRPFWMIEDEAVREGIRVAFETGAALVALIFFMCVPFYLYYDHKESRKSA